MQLLYQTYKIFDKIRRLCYNTYLTDGSGKNEKYLKKLKTYVIYLGVVTTMIIIVAVVYKNPDLFTFANPNNEFLKKK